ncbi:hypothetical protein GCM10009801_57640 [Streptomyces albiaxialis]|uniref:Glycerophosphoryl diester phosphodiesterase membrane domain-containing protein n=1 Tax=Streptomyces albiaxialis TaxID=329523 RepID=A0ABP5I142_9ACTN
MNDSPGWASPGSSSSDPRPNPGKGGQDDDKERTTSEATPQTPSDQPPTAPDRTEAPSDQHPRNWSAQQPPASGAPGWGAAPPPPNRPGPGRPGPGGPAPGGWNTPWAQTPQAAKPGVVPLRPLGVGEILDGAVSTMRAHWRTVLGIALAVAVITQLASTVAVGIWFPESGDLDALSNDPDPTLDEFSDALGGALGSLGVAMVVGMLGSVIATAMLTVVVSRAVLGRGVTIGEAWRDSRPQLLRLLGLLLLVPVLITVVMLLCLTPGLAAVAGDSANLALSFLFLGMLAGTVAAAWLWVRYCLAAPALMLEKQGVLTSMRRSAKLVRGSWWRIFGIQLLALILVFIVSSVVQMPTTFIATLVGGDGGTSLTGAAAATGWTSLIISGIGSVVASTISLPVSAGVTALLYLDQRIRREALDLELARAAGVPGYGDPQADRPTPGS